MCGTIGNDSGVTIGKTSPGGGSGPGIAQNNITKVVDLGYYQPNTTDFQDKLDALNLTVLETDSPVYFRAITKLENGLLIKQLFEFTPGKGVYEPVGATTTFDDLLIIEETYPNLADIEDILLLGNVIDLGEIATNDIVSYINGLNEIDFTDDSVINYVQFVSNGLTYIYEYVGIAQIYGTSTTNIISSIDLDLIYHSGNDNSSNLETPSFQDTLNVSEYGNKIKLGDSNFFNGGTGFLGASIGAIEILETGKLLVYGTFSTYKGASKVNIVLLDQLGNVDLSFDTGAGFNSGISKIIRFNDLFICVGSFTTYKGVTANRIVCLNASGDIDTSIDFGTGFDATVLEILNHGNYFYIGGFFTSYNGTAANRIISLNQDGTINTGFVYGAGFSGTVQPQIRSIIEKNSKLYCFGSFTTYNANARNNAVSVNLDGSINNVFNIGTGFNEIVITAKFDNQNDNVIFIGGSFTTYKGLSNNKIISVDITGTKNASFDTGVGFNNDVFSIGMLNNDILVTGTFITYKGITANKIIRISKNSGQKSIGNFDANSSVFGHTILKSDKILFLGIFNSYNGLATPTGLLITDFSGIRNETVQDTKFTYNRNNNKIAEYFSDLYAQLTNYELINKKLLEQRISLLKYEQTVHYRANEIIGSHTGDLLERVLYSFDASNIFELGDSMPIYPNMSKDASAGNVTYKIRIGTTGTTADTQAALFTAATVNSRVTNMERKNCVFVAGNLLRVFGSTVTSITDAATGGSPTFIPINLANLKITITAQLTVASETASLVGLLITKIRK